MYSESGRVRSGRVCSQCGDSEGVTLVQLTGSLYAYMSGTPLSNRHTEGVGVLSTVERLSLSQRLLMYNRHMGGGVRGALSTVERLFLSQRLLNL